MMQGCEGQVTVFGRGPVKRLKRKGDESDVAVQRVTISIQSAFYSVLGSVLCAPNAIPFILGKSLG